MEKSKNHLYSIYETVDSINIKEIQQGDIFKNIPYYSPDFLMKATMKHEDRYVKNEKKEIFREIIQKSNSILVESVIFPTLAILASQNCDIRKGYDLIFFPIVKYKEPREHVNFREFVERDIRDWNRYMYLPKNYVSNGKEVGPFRILFQNPFYIPFEVIEENLKNCWVSHISKKAKKILKGKITNFFTRTPVDELIFLKIDELEYYFESKWEKIWNEAIKTPYNESASVLIEKIIEFYYSLKQEKKEKYFLNLDILDWGLIKEIEGLVSKNWILEEPSDFQKYYKTINSENQENYFVRFFNLLNSALYNSDNIFTEFSLIIELLKDLDDDNFVEFKRNKIKSKFRKEDFTLEVLKKISESPINQKDKFLTYCEPFKRLEEFLKQINVIED